MGRVAAYYRAHFVIDKATSTEIDGGFKVTWESPHPAMPKSVPLRVKIEGADGKTVKQKGKEIQAESDGSFVIEFMDLELEVVGAAAPESSSSEEVQSSSSEAPSSSTTAITQNFQWASQEPTTFAVFSATGVLVKSFEAIPQSAEGTFKALQTPHGTYYLKDLKSSYIKKVAK